MKPAPSESFILWQRLITFFDEWLFYGLLLYLFLYREDYVLGTIVGLLGATFIIASYGRIWSMELRRFGKIEDSLRE